MKTIQELLAVAGITLAVCVTGCKSTPPPARLSSAQMADNAFTTQQWESASVHYSDAISEDGQRYNFHFNRGISYKHLGRSEEALDDFSEASELYPNDGGKSLLEAAQVAMSLNKYGKAIQLTDKLLERSPTHSEAKDLRLQALLSQAQEYHQRKNYSAALISLESYLKTVQNNDVKVFKAECLFLNAKRSSERSDANLYFKKLLKTLPKRSQQWQTVQKIYAQNLFYLREARQARQEFDAYMTVRNNITTPDDIFWAGLIAKVNLDKEAQNRYWSKIGKAYLTKQLNSIKATQGVH